jgi:hypothetical protein
MKIDLDQQKTLHRVHGLTGFELAMAAQRWAELADAKDPRTLDDGPLGPPWMKTKEAEGGAYRYAETHEDWGQRVALALIKLADEV